MSKSTCWRLALLPLGNDKIKAAHHNADLKANKGGECISRGSVSVQVGEFEISVKAGKLGSHERGPSLKPYVGSATEPTPEGFLRKDTALYLKGGDPVTDAVEARCSKMPLHNLSERVYPILRRLPARNLAFLVAYLDCSLARPRF